MAITSKKNKTKQEIQRTYRENNKENINEYSKEYRKKNRDIINLRSKQWRANNKEKLRLKRLEMKNEAYAGYGGYVCNCCREKESLFLTIDHINNDGPAMRKIHGVGFQFYRWLVKNGHPSGFQILCFNCQWGKYLNNGICPHKKEKEKTNVT